MSFQKLILTIDRSTGNALRDFSSSVLFNLPDLKQSDQLDIDFRLVDPTRSASQPWRYLDLTDYTVRAAIGVPGNAFTSGTFLTSYDGTDSATPLSFFATPSQLETNLNAIASIDAAGGVTVSGGMGSPYKITFNDVGAREIIGFDTDKIFPRATAQSFILTEGDVSTRQVQFVSLSREPATVSDDFTDLPAASASVTVISEGGSGSNEIVELDLSDPEPYAGVYRIIIDSETSAIIDFDADAETIQGILETMVAVGTDNVTVTGVFPVFTIEFIGSLSDTDIGAISLDVSSLKVAIGKRGVLDLDQSGIYELLADGSSAQAKLEIEVLDLDEKVFTACQLDVTIINDILYNSPIPSSNPRYLSDFVSYRVQAPTPERQQRARLNINAESPEGAQAKVDGLEDSLGSAAFSNVEDFATPASVEAQLLAEGIDLTNGIFAGSAGQFGNITNYDASAAPNFPLGLNLADSSLGSGIYWPDVGFLAYIEAGGVPGSSYIGMGNVDQVSINSAVYVSGGVYNDYLYSNAGALGIDMASQLLIKGSDGSYTVDWSNRNLYNSYGNYSVDWEFCSLHDPYGTYSIDWGNRYMVDTSGGYCIDWGNRQLLDPSFGTVVAQWGTGTFFEADYIYGINGSLGIDFTNSALMDASTKTLDWYARTLLDGTGSNVSADWGYRQLIASDGSIAMDWTLAEPDFPNGLITSKSAPASSDPGNPGQMVFTDDYIYRCFASGDWRRSGVTYHSSY